MRRFQTRAAVSRVGLDGALGRGRRKEHGPMFRLSITSNITVTIGHYTRLHFAFVTTARSE
jgi:hypothetical protein